MPDLKNHTEHDIEAASGHLIRAHETLSVSIKTLERLKKQPYIARHLAQRTLTVEHGTAGGVDLRKVIAGGTRKELVEIVMAHSDWTEEDLKHVTVEGREGEDGLRDMAERLVFVSL